jgi:hypothetical protein
LLDAAERERKRIVRVVQGLQAPFITAEPVLPEACFLLAAVKGGSLNLLGTVREGCLWWVSLSRRSSTRLMRRNRGIERVDLDGCWPTSAACDGP